MKPTKEVRKAYRDNNPEKIKENNDRTNKYAFNYKGKIIYLGYNPRKGKCLWCGKEGKTVLHHEKYHDDEPLKDTVEICQKCHKIHHDKINKQNQEDAELCQQLIKILSNHCGETGNNEGAVETLNRIIEDAEMFEYGEKHSVENNKIVERLKKLIEDKKWYGRDATVEELQKILGEEK